jgi:hypothetical protein
MGDFPEERWWELARHPHSVVRLNLATNPYLPWNILDFLLDDPQDGPLICLAKRDDLPPEAIERLSHHPSPIVRMALLNTLSKDHELQTRHQADKDVLVQTFGRLSATDPAFHDGDGSVEIARDRLAEQVSAWQEMARSWDIGPEILDEIGQSLSPHLRRLVARNPATALFTLERLRGDLDETVRELARKRLPEKPVQAVRSEADLAMTRVAASQLGSLCRGGLLAMFREAAPGWGEKMTKLLETELGKGMLMSLLSIGLGMTGARWPASWQGSVAILSTELRVGALTRAGDAMVDLVTGPVRALLSTLGEEERTEVVLQLEGAARSVVGTEKIAAEVML